MKTARFSWIALFVIIAGLLVGLGIHYVGMWFRYSSAPQAESVDILNNYILADRNQSSDRKLNVRQIENLLYSYTELIDEETLKQLDYSGKSPTDFFSQQLLLSGSMMRNLNCCPATHASLS